MNAQAIRNARLSLGLTQAAFAERLGISDRYVRNLERGDRQAGNALARIIAIETQGGAL
jgi:transcriptional regulator with XRE-family HTH domain